MKQTIPLEFPTTATQSTSIKTKITALIKNLATLTLLLLALPINGAIVLLSLLFSAIIRPFQTPVVAAEPKNIMISGGRTAKALQLARSFHMCGHRVVFVETHKYWFSGHRYSKAVSAFHTVPPPLKDPDGHIEGLIEIIKKENIDFYIPIATLNRPVLSQYCEVFHFEPNISRMLDDKYDFSEKARSFGLTVPKCFKITNPQQVLNFDFSQETRKYILKSIPYDSIRRLNLTKLPCATPEETAAFVKSLPISPEKPWVMQEFISGKEYCTHSNIRNGKLTLHCCSESSAFQLNYENVEHPKILEWVQHFAKELGVTGQLSFDFIEAEDGTVYAIECNARTHSAITMFYNHPGVADAYLKEAQAVPLQPLPNSKPTYLLYHEIWRLTSIRSLEQLRTWFKNLLRGKDSIYSFQDPLPFLTLHHWQIPLLLLQNLQQLKGWIRIDFNTGKLVEPDGD